MQKWAQGGRAKKNVIETQNYNNFVQKETKKSPTLVDFYLKMRFKVDNFLWYHLQIYSTATPFLGFWPKFWLLSKISFFNQKLLFFWKFEFLSKILIFTEISISTAISMFTEISISTAISIFTEISTFDQNLDFDPSLDSWPKLK